MATPDFPLFAADGRRIDQVWTPLHQQALADYSANRPHMKKRFLQQDDQAVLWHNAAATRATLWNFAAREVALPGTVTDLSTGELLPPADHYQLLAYHTYKITGVQPLPAVIEGK